MPPHVVHRNRIVRVDLTKIVANAISESHLEVDQAAASSTVTLANTERFAVGGFVWINPFSEKSEIVAVHASTAPVQSTGVLTLAANTVYAHQAGEKVYYVEYDQVEINHAPTEGGSKSVLATLAIPAGEEEVRYLDVSQTSGFYSARFNDSVAATFGSYSDEVAYGGWSANEVGYMIDRALRDLGITLSSDITLDDCYAWITEGLLFVDGKQVKWPEHISYNSIVGQTARGINTITMPTDAYDTETNRSILGVRIGDGRNLRYLDPVTFDAQMGKAKSTQVRTEASANDASLAVDNSYDFRDSGSLAAYVAGVKDTFTYTAVTRDTATGGTAAFTGVPTSGDSAIGQTITVDTNIWQDEVEGIPIHFTVRNGNLEFWPLCDASEDNQNVFMDYALVATTIDSDTDTIDFHRYDMMFEYLKWRMKMKNENNGELDMNDHIYLIFKEKLNDAVRTSPPSNKFRMSPNVNRMTRRGGRTADLQDINIDDQ